MNNWIKEERKWSYYYKSGELESIIYFENGSKIITHEKYYENGSLKIICNFFEGKLNGIYEEYFDNGQLKKKYIYKKDKTDGLFEEYYENGQLKVSGVFKEGLINGPYLEYFINGNLYRKCFLHFYDPNRRLVEDYDEEYNTFRFHCKGTYEENYFNGHLREDWSENELWDSRKEYYKNGQLKEIVSFEMGRVMKGPYRIKDEDENYYFEDYWGRDLWDYKRNGPYEKYFENGRLNIKCNYNDDKLNGSYEEYFENGQLKIKCEYKHDKLNGSYKEYFENGQLKIKCEYKDGRRNGPLERYLENGHLSEKEVYKEGFLNGPYEYYNYIIQRNGPYECDNYISKSSSKGFLKMFDPKDKYTQLFGKTSKRKLYNIGPYEEYSSGKLCEKWFENDSWDCKEKYFENGQLKELVSYEKGFLRDDPSKRYKNNGPYEEYFENGQLKLKCNYEDDKKTGTYEEYYENGQLKLNCNHEGSSHHDFFISGPYEEYFENGQLKLKTIYLYNEGTVKRGFTYDRWSKRNGPFEEYFENGQLKIKSNITRNEKNGPYEEYFENGQLKIKCHYDFDIRTGLYEEYHENGQLKVKTNFINDMFSENSKFIKNSLEGIFEEYFENGQLKGRINFSEEGYMDGPYEIYYQNGQLKEKSTFKYGNLKGTYEKYDEKGVLIDYVDDKNETVDRDYFFTDGYLSIKFDQKGPLWIDPPEDIEPYGGWDDSGENWILD